jgi:hypothetical protein
MKIILVSAGNFQEYIIDNIKNLKLFGNIDIVVITEKKFFPLLVDLSVILVDTSDLEDFNFNNNSQLDKNFRNGFWHLCSLRLFYLYSYISKNNLVNCIHLENDVLTYINFDNILNCFKKNKIYATFDCDKRVVPGILFIPTSQALKPMIDSYNFSLNDMQNLAYLNEAYIEPLPIGPIIDSYINKLNKNFIEFNLIFDAAAMGQYLGGIDKRNDSNETRGFINETCLIKYNQYIFYWININNLYVPHLSINGKLIRIVNLHIHSKALHNFMGDNPIEDKFIIKKNIVDL